MVRNLSRSRHARPGACRTSPAGIGSRPVAAGWGPAAARGVGKLGKPGGSCGFWRPFSAFRRSDRAGAAAALAAAALALPAGAGAHAERATFFPDPDQGAFPEYRTTGPALVVCAAGHEAADQALPRPEAARDAPAPAEGLRVRHDPGGGERRPERHADPRDAGRLRGARQPRAGPGRLRGRLPAHRGRAVRADLRGAPPVPERPEPDRDPGRHERRPHLRLQVQHPDRGHRLTGPTTSRSPVERVEAERDPRRPRRRRRTCANFKVELSDFNNIYVLETNGFRIDRVESGYSREYGILSFTSRPRHLRELRDLRQRRLGRLPGLGSRPSRPAGRARPRVRDRDPQLQLARQQHRVVRARRATARCSTTTSSTTTRSASRRTRSRAGTRASRRTPRSGPTT